MGLETILAIGAIAIAAGTAAYAIISSPDANQDGMNPASLDEFRVTQAKEGSVVPLVYGRVRVTGNIMWYGDLRTEEVEAPGGGKGGAPSGAAGYKYFISCWQGICLGKVSFIKTYINNNEEEIEADNILWNDGTQSTKPTNLQYASALPGVAHVYLDGWYIGDNVRTAPTIHYVVERILPDIVVGPNLETGSNPAAIIYDILQYAGVPSSKIDLARFNEAAAYYNTRDYGLNLVFNSAMEAGQMIEQVLNYVDGVLYINDQGQYALVPIDGNYNQDSRLFELYEKDMDDFSLIRRSWSQIPNDFHGTYLDESNDFTQRVILAQNPAVIRLAGGRNTVNVDMKGFREINPASERLWDIMKRDSYPAAEIQFETDLRLSPVYPGEIIRIHHSDYGIVSADFRVMSIDAAKIDDNKVKVEARQVTETIWSNAYMGGGGSLWQDPVTDPVPLDHVGVFELPYNSTTRWGPAYIVLAARKILVETGAQVYVSADLTENYRLAGTLKSFAQYGTLDADYPDDTYMVDDTTGILFTAYKRDPVFSTVSRASAFSPVRIAIVDNEIMCFEKVIAMGGDQYKLLGVVRGVLGTKREAHTSGASIWLVGSSAFVLQNVGFDDFYVKVVPQFLDKVADISQVDGVNYTATNKAKKPRDVSRIAATRTGSTVAVQLWPTSPGVDGAGDSPESVTDSAPPFDFAGDFEISGGVATEIKQSDSFNINQAGAFDLTVKSRLNGYTSSGITVSIGAGDGVYTA